MSFDLLPPTAGFGEMLRGVRCAASTSRCLPLTVYVAKAAAVASSATSRSSSRQQPTRRRLHSAAAVRASSSNSIGNGKGTVDDDGSSPTSSQWTPPPEDNDAGAKHDETAVSEHAVLSTFDLFSIGIGPSSSVSERSEARHHHAHNLLMNPQHTVGPMRAGAIFANDLAEVGLLKQVEKIRISLYGSLAATGEGHMTPSALLLGLEGESCETIDTAIVPLRFEEIKEKRELHLGGKEGKLISFDYEKEFIFEYGRSLPLHSNGMRLTVFDKDGTMLATNDLFSVGGGFVVNGALSTATTAKAKSTSSSSAHPIDLQENIYYKEIKRSDAASDRRVGIDTSQSAEQNQPAQIEEQQASSALSATSSSQDNNVIKTTVSTQPPYPFRDAKSLLALCQKHNLTIAQLVYENERHWYTDAEIRQKLTNIWLVMDNCIREGVHSEQEILPGSLKLKRRAPGLYRRLTRGLYPSLERPSTMQSSASIGPGSSQVSETKQEPSGKRTSLIASKGPPRVHGSFQHPILPTPPRRTMFPTMDHLTVYAMAVNEVNAAGGRVVTAPTNGAAGIIPAVLKYIIEFVSDDEERDVFTFLLTSAALAMLYKRGATISAAEGGCMSEVGVACSMAAGAFAACMGASPKTVEQAAEIGIEHNLGLTCDPVGGLVQAPCIERNGLGAVKAVVSANLAMSSPGGKISLDDAIRAMKVTAEGMRNEFKETSLSGLATSVQIPVSVPDC